MMEVFEFIGVIEIVEENEKLLGGITKQLLYP